jgi:surface polysaccharide O-acyltransferase-like enzyme
MATPTRATPSADVLRTNTFTPHRAISVAAGGRSDGWDALKGIAIIGVVTIHSLFVATRAVPSRSVAVASAGLGVAVPTFILLSALLASREAMRSSAGTAVLRRVVRLVPLYLIWTGVYIALSYLSGGPDLVQLRRSSVVAVLLFGGSWYHLYFLPALIQLLVALPLLVLLVKTPLRARVALLAGIVFLALGPLVSGASSPGGHSPHHHLVVALFSSSYVFVWIPFGLAGAAVAMGTVAIRRPARWVAIGFVVFTLETLEGLATHTSPSTGYARAGFLMAAIGAIGATRHWSSPPRWLVTLGRYSLGVFLLHPILLWVIRPVVVSSSGLWLLPVIVAGVVTGSAVLVIALGRTRARILIDGRSTPGGYGASSRWVRVDGGQSSPLEVKELL